VVRSVDSDVVVLAVSFYGEFLLQGLSELWVQYGVGQKTRCISIHDIYHSLGPYKAVSLRGFNSFTGCDVVSAFFEKGKKTCWNTLNRHEDSWRAFYALSFPLNEMPETVMKELEEFVIRLYSGTKATCDEARLELYTGRRNKPLEKLPPTSNALQQHILRAAFQAGQVWGRALEVIIEPVYPQGWGWQQAGADGGWSPVWTTKDTVWAACREILVKCGCRSCVAGRCTCKKAGLHCTLYCNCTGECAAAEHE